jgi:hypothetical protein
VDVFAHLGTGAADGPLQDGLLGDDVGGAPRLHTADGDHGGVSGIDLARNQCLDGRDQKAGDDDRIHGLVRPGAVATLALHMDGEAVRVGRDDAVGDHDFADAVTAGDVTAEDGGYALEPPRSNDDLGTAAAFLRRLEDEADVSPRRRLLQQRCSTKEHGHVAVVTAGMHDARIAGGKGQSRGFFPRQAVHIGAQGDGGRLHPTEIHVCDHPSALAAVFVRNLQAVEFLHDQGRRVLLLKGQFRPPMEGTAQFHQVGVDVFGVLDKHRLPRRPVQIIAHMGCMRFASCL